MHRIRRSIVTDEAKRPIAVQIDYEDWLQIERLLHLQENETGPDDLSRYGGTIRLSEDPLTYQARVRGEWS